MKLKIASFILATMLLTACGAKSSQESEQPGSSSTSVEPSTETSTQPGPVPVEGFLVTFVTDEHVKVQIFTTKDFASDPVEAEYAYTRDGDTGEYTKENGQVCFKLIFDEGYTVDGSLDVTGTYKNVKTPRDNEIENAYRITYVESDLTVSIKSKLEGEEEGFDVTFVAQHCKIIVYPGQNYDVDGVETLTTKTINPDTGKLSKDPEFAQINFTVVPDEGYEHDFPTYVDEDDNVKSECIEGEYKNLKSQSSKKANTWRITKIGGNLTITVTCTQPE